MMELRFDDRVVLITGASTGIGAALARGFAGAGAAVVVHYGQSGAAAAAVADEIAAAGGQALLYQADVRDSAALAGLRDATLARFGRIDVLINNAGSMVRRMPIADADDALLHEVIDVNFTATVALSRLAIPTMRAQGGGTIINVTSVAARHGGGAGAVLYAASKGAVSTFTRGLAKELAGSRIRVNALAPGVIVTPFHDRFTSEQQMATMVATIPMGRAGTPDECVGAALFLASDALSGYITGQIIEINGGQYMP
jgi:3-oxoacyl-[acyl-carrier protein] reductase